MSWLTRLEIDIESTWKERIKDNYDWHKKIWECFPETGSNVKRDFLTRIDTFESGFKVWILAQKKPICPNWCSRENFKLKEVAPSFLAHRYYAFDLRANPTRKLVQRDSTGKRLKGKRIPIVDHEELRTWLIQKGKIRCNKPITGEPIPGGFTLFEQHPLEISPMVENHFRKKSHQAYHGGVQFRGIIEVTDFEKFKETYHYGIGSAKSFGFGLLLLAPINVKGVKK